MCDIIPLNPELPAETVGIVERGVEAIIANAIAGLAMPSSAYVAVSGLMTRQVERRMKSERDSARRVLRRLGRGGRDVERDRPAQSRTNTANCTTAIYRP